MNMKKIIIIILSSFIIFFSGCSKKIKINFDPYNGVQYLLEQSDYYGYIIIRLDPINDDVISSIRIIYTDKTDNTIDKDYIANLNKKYLTYPPFQENSKYSYYYVDRKESQNDNVGYSEYIEINFYESIDLKELQILLEHIGLSKELNDGILMYETELLKSKDFNYMKIIESGKYIENVMY